MDCSFSAIPGVFAALAIAQPRGTTGVLGPGSWRDGGDGNQHASVTAFLLSAPDAIGHLSDSPPIKPGFLYIMAPHSSTHAKYKSSINAGVGGALSSTD